jgi:hypothetical protein
VGNSKSQLHKAKLRIREFLTEPGKNAVTVRLEDASELESAPSSKARRSAIGFSEAASALS